MLGQVTSADNKKGALSAFLAELRRQDSNLRPSGYEPDELPDCSTPRQREGTYLETARASSFFIFFSLPL